MDESLANTWTRSICFAVGQDPAEGYGRVSLLLEELDAHLRSIPGLDTAGAGELRLVADEIGSNIVRHAVRERSVELAIEVEDNGESVRLRVIDNGCEFNPFVQGAPYVGADLDKRRVGGLGLYLVRQLFPLASYRRRDGFNISEVEYCPGEGGRERMRRGT